MVDDTKKLEIIFSKIREDPIFFISNFIKVVHPKRGLVKFDLYEFQKRILREIKGHRFNILKKFRQAGCTTLVSAYALWLCLYTPYTSIAVLSKGDVESTEIIDRIKIMYDELALPPSLKPSLIKGKDNKHTIGFSNGSVIKSRSSGKQAGRSISGSLLILDEAAFIENLDTIWAASYPIISTGGSVIALSTCNGVGNWFFHKWSEAEKGDNEFNPININWKDHPEYCRQPGYEWLYEKMLNYDPPVNVDNWETATRKNMKYSEWLQEFEATFIGTGDTYIDGEILKQLKENVNKNYTIKYNNKMRVWKDPEPNRTYAMGCDISIGRGRDYSAFHIFDVYSGEQVAEFYSNRTPINEYADICVREASLYNTAYILPERNTIGDNFLYFLFEVHEYENIMQDDNREFGINISGKNRENLLANMEDAIRNIRVKINSERTVDELLTFIIDPDTGKIKADNHCHDDLIMSLALSVHAFNEIRLNPLIEKPQNSFSDKYYPTIFNNKYNKDNQVIVTTATGKIEVEDLSWLLNK